MGGLRAMLTGRNIDEDLLEELEAKLIQADVGVQAATQIVEDLREAHKDGRVEKGEDVIGFLKTEIKSYWPPADRSVHMAAEGPTVILVAGINGAGKTTSVAKLTWYFQQQGKKVVLAAGDTYRAAAVEQLTIWSDRLGVDIIKSSTGGDPGAVVWDACDAALARDADVLLVDTAGRLHVGKPHA